MKYNIAIMKNKNCTDMDISDSIEKLERFNKQIIERRVTVNNKAARVEAVNAKNYEDGVGPMSQDDPYLRLPWDKHPKYMPFDAYMYPAVTLSVMLSAQAENTLLTTPLSQGMAIEAGILYFAGKSVYLYDFPFYCSFNFAVFIIIFGRYNEKCLPNYY